MRVDLDLDPEPARIRVVIFGGHVRDERKMTRRLFERSPFEIRWKPFEKGARNPDARELEDAVSHAEAVLLVTSMVSHNIMRIVKRLTQQAGIPFRAITKATDTQLKSVLAELFPQISLGNGADSGKPIA